MRVGTFIAFCPVLLASTSLALGAQLAVATHDVNLRPNPSTHDPPLRAIAAGDTVTLLAPDTTNGFVHLRTGSDGTDGWVYSRYVDVVDAPAAGGPVAVKRPTLPRGVESAPASYHGCPNEGINRSGRTPALPIQSLNVLKNRYAAPAPAQIDSAITLGAILAPGDDGTRFGRGRGAEIVGVVTDVQVGGRETTNCEATSPTYRDTHIRIALTPSAPENRRVVVEVTPRWREAMAAIGIDWSTATLAETLVGRTVRVGGWMLFDTEHAKQSENTSPGNPKNWRATAWEIHPVTVLEVLPQ
jgi:hypothetical protein